MQAGVRALVYGSVIAVIGVSFAVGCTLHTYEVRPHPLVLAPYRSGMNEQRRIEEQAGGGAGAEHVVAVRCASVRTVCSPPALPLAV